MPLFVSFNYIYVCVKQAAYMSSLHSSLSCMSKQCLEHGNDINYGGKI
jgi:hypothetical protein